MHYVIEFIQQLIRQLGQSRTATCRMATDSNERLRKYRSLLYANKKKDFRLIARDGEVPIHGEILKENAELLHPASPNLRIADYSVNVVTLFVEHLNGIDAFTHDLPLKLAFELTWLFQRFGVEQALTAGVRYCMKKCPTSTMQQFCDATDIDKFTQYIVAVLMEKRKKEMNKNKESISKTLVTTDLLSSNSATRAVLDYMRQRHESNLKNRVADLGIPVADVVRDVPQCMGSTSTTKTILETLAANGDLYTFNDIHFAYCKIHEIRSQLANLP